MPELVPVRVRDCACPHTPHAVEGDIVYLAPHLDIRGGSRAERELIQANTDAGLLTSLWLETFVLFGAKGWNLLDEDGEPVPFDVDTITSDWALARPVGDAASALYQDSILAPFVKAQQVRSPTGSTSATTSPRQRRTKT
jgi:hypothetical protein